MMSRLTRTLLNQGRRVASPFLFSRCVHPSALHSPPAFQRSAAFSTSAPDLGFKQKAGHSGNEKTEPGSDSEKFVIQDFAKKSLLDVKGNPSTATESSNSDMFSYKHPTGAAVKKPKIPFKDGKHTESRVLGNETRRGVGQKQRSPTKISIAMKSFDHPFLENWELPPHTRQIGLPDSRVLYTVLRSPHIDKKSREQFEMKIKKMVVQTETRDLRKKFFWLKRQRIFGAQYEIVFSCKTRLDNEKLQSLL